MKAATERQRRQRHTTRKNYFANGPPARRIPQHGAPRRGEGFGGGYPPLKRNMCSEHVWACLACVCCRCVCGSGVRRETHLSSRLVAVTTSHMRGPGEGWGRGRVFPPSMRFHQRACEISRPRASFTKVYRPKVIDQPRG